MTCPSLKRLTRDGGEGEMWVCTARGWVASQYASVRALCRDCPQKQGADPILESEEGK